jgi:hypothetical protein
LNRQFLHPLGLALEVIINDETGEETLGGIWDYRDDPEGMFFNDLSKDLNYEKAYNVEKEKIKKGKYRHNKYGFGIQPIGHSFKDEEPEIE